MQSISKKRAQSRRMNVIKRAKIVQEMTMKLYEPGNQSRSKAQAYRQQVNNIYPMGERTFWRYMSMNIEKELQDAQCGQMVLQFD
ncbi:hypothetical protein JGH11_02680 [Dysgonomonas sp. Marseille-P4677]|uniref:hypothetical protein n=1 Tax=Dysgonomonas sp. Marseille-P4677 TaxID=2364790 RepID=UPI0019127B72|nr:hypothetical protein [Dysgonomonas sp. Marseille-P4677]MBK5719773.1 hypothetical protein [Dysgonomonas sp. Marseille-P4677]